MTRTMLEKYAALVCFVSMACLAIGAGMIIYSAIGIAYPQVTLNPLKIPPMDFPTAEETEAARADVPTLSTLTKEDRVKRRAIWIQTAIVNERKTSLQSAIGWSIWSVISGLVFATHWRVLRRGQPHA